VEEFETFITLDAFDLLLGNRMFEVEWNLLDYIFLWLLVLDCSIK
jgi:hypothetical protein